MADIIDVTTVAAGREVHAGRIYRTRTSGAFEYDTAYLRDRTAFALTPALGLYPGPQALAPHNPFSDSAPDTWGRKVQTRAAGRQLDELTLLLGVNDEGRQGATRFWIDGVAVADGDGVPDVADLAELLRVADQVDRGDSRIDNTALRRLYRATGSLGGARPKANVRVGREMWLAKFPKPIGDHWNKMAWEAAMLDTMAEAGIEVPEHRTTRVTLNGTARTVLLLRRFDRADERRVPYISGMTALESQDGEGGDWVDLVDFCRLSGGDPTELWRRATFGAAVGNLDDHLRNHGFLRRNAAWVPSPAFDVNPEPLAQGHQHELMLFGNADLTVDSFFTADALDLFGVSIAVASQYRTSLATALSAATRAAELHGADGHSLSIMRSRIDNAVMQLA